MSSHFCFLYKLVDLVLLTLFFSLDGLEKSEVQPPTETPLATISTGVPQVLGLMGRQRLRFNIKCITQIKII